MNICGVNKCTEIGGKAITHNCWALQYLNMEDLDLITDDVFQFDNVGDGRRAADENMLTNITELNISECSRLTDRGVGAISQRCEKLSVLNLSGCSLLTDTSAQNLIREPRTGGPRGELLKDVKLSYCMLLTDKATDFLSRRSTKIESLDMSGCVHLTDDGIRRLVSRCSSIQHITLSRCKRLTDKALCNLADYLWVESLDISSNNKITDEGIDVVALEFAGLIKLNISDCEKITNRSIVSLGRHCRNLKELQAVNLKNVSKECLEELTTILPKCHVVWMANEILPMPPGGAAAAAGGGKAPSNQSP